MKASILALTFSAALASAQNSTVPYTTSTISQTKVYTVTSCAATVTDCPARIGKVTTEISVTTTYCPVSGASSTAIVLPPPTTAALSTGTVTQTTTYTISSCAPTVTNCPYGSTTTSTYLQTTVVAPPVSTGASVVVSAVKSPSVPAAGSVTGGASIPATTLSPPVSTGPASIPKASGPVTSVMTISTCVPTVITSVVTVFPSSPAGAACPGCATTVVSSAKPYGTAAPSAPVGFTGTNNTIVPFTGAASAQKAGGLLMAVGLAAFLL
ncbi:hypothetical protein LOCC1_G007481 [Lachnellula occidentalis]|uniref:GPI anchored serine-rich protein n=1 Tax=Lachnellula occidentalis TaxID=215460 RepID=A0A8H8UED6_9HELO|nr:hypothetical protein LOCC1_G007481 [Lachnellula occidentalis]